MPKEVTEDEAKETLDKMRNVSLGFCPQINSLCCLDCVCYNNGTVEKVDDNYVSGSEIQPIYRWRVYKPYCRHGLHGQADFEITI